jgi:hypothetical protein
MLIARFRGLSVLVAALLMSGMTPAQAQTTATVPAQFVAKLYTEALGRAPDQGGWSAGIAFFEADGCTAATLAALGQFFYLSPEFLADYPDHAARVLALYRGALNRDPEQGGLDHAVAFLEQGGSWADLVDGLFASAEFDGDVPAICSASIFGTGFGSQTPPKPVPGTVGFTGSEAALQAALDAASPGSTILLAQKAVVTLTTILTIPTGVTLSTAGAPRRPPMP